MICGMCNREIGHAKMFYTFLCDDCVPQKAFENAERLLSLALEQNDLESAEKYAKNAVKWREILQERSDAR